jgi:uncharacterized membrane protein YuzA (DUF378 family)
LSALDFGWGLEFCSLGFFEDFDLMTLILGVCFGARAESITALGLCAIAKNPSFFGLNGSGSVP